MTGHPMDDDTVSVSEAAALLGVHRNTIHYRIQHGHLVGQRVVNPNGDSVWRIPKSSLPTVRARGNQRAAIVPKAQHDEQTAAIQALLAQFGDAERRTGRAEAERDAAQLDAQRERDRADALELELQRLRGTAAPAQQAVAPSPQPLWSRLKQRIRR